MREREGDGRIEGGRGGRKWEGGKRREREGGRERERVRERGVCV